MEIRERIDALKTAALQNIQVSARRGESEHVLECSRKLELIQALEARYRSLVGDLAALEEPRPERLVFGHADLGHADPGHADRVHSDPGHADPGNVDLGRANPERGGGGHAGEDDAPLSRRRMGEKRRLELVEKLRLLRIHLLRLKGPIFMSPSGVRLGIAYASEAQEGKYFPGLPDAGFNHAILRCEAAGGEIADISLPKSFLSQYGPSLSKSHGQVKFNVARRGREFFLIVPGAGAVSVEAYRDDFTALRGRV